MKKSYYVSPNNINDDWVAPEETLLDSSSHYSDIEKPIPASVFRSFFAVICVLLSVILGFVFSLSVIKNKIYAESAFQNKSANFPLSPPRGIIFDRNGKLLVQNIPVFNMLAVSRGIRESGEELKNNLVKISSVLGQDEESLRTSVLAGLKSNETFFVHRNLTKEQAVILEYLKPQGFYVVPDIKRDYINGSKISHVLGYTSKVSQEDLADDDYYVITDTIGKLGIEYEYEEYLRGVHGNIFFSKEDGGNITKSAESGSSVFLNIDYDLQIQLYDELYAGLRDAGLSRAVGVVQNPRTGAVMALVSLPGFDNNIFSSKISENDYARLFENKARPLFNRAIGGLYNPGSTIKPYIGLAALEEKIISPDTAIDDCISISIPNPADSSKPYIFGNWRAEFGPFNLKRAIANSCNIYFFSVGGGYGGIDGLGIERIADYLKSGLVNSVLGIDLPGEASGFVPTPEWKLRERSEGWYLGDTYNVSIGQGDLLATPLWLNSYISAVANGGTIYQPQVADRIINHDRKVIFDIEPKPAGQLPFSRENINEIKNAMKETTVSGTAQIFNQLPVRVAAKTGTAEVVKGRVVNSLFTAFGPYENPEIAMTVLIEGSSANQGLAVRAAYNFLSWYFNR